MSHMDIMTFIKEWSSLILSVLTILGGLWGYFKHDKKLKSQEKRLNDLQIKQFEKEEAKEKMAEIKANVIRGVKGNHKIRFINSGKSDAINVRIDILTPKEEMSSIRCKNTWGPYEMINPQTYREEMLTLCLGHPNVIKIKVTWDDGYMKDRVTNLSVSI